LARLAPIGLDAAKPACSLSIVLTQARSSSAPPVGDNSEAVLDLQIPEPQGQFPNDLTGDLANRHLSLVKSSPARPQAHENRVALVEDRVALVSALRQRDERAAAAFFREFEPLVARTVGRILGFGDDLPDAVQEAFLRATLSLERLREPQALVDWLQQIAVYTAMDCLRRRKRRRWLRFFDQNPAEEVAAPERDEAETDALRATYRVLDRLSVEERSVFALRFIDGMEIDALANAHDCSRSTIKRRLARATARFRALAQHETALASWITSNEIENEEEGL
jgi:RNA polymerase sigma-70 factor (ECF subfamily)